MKKLNLGCSCHYFDGWTNLDIGDKDTYGNEIKIDVIHDLNTYPYPFKDNEFDYIHAYAIIEHLDNPSSAMKELKRILKPDGELEVLVPHFSAWLNHSDPTHKWMYSIKMGNHILFNHGMEVVSGKIVFSENKVLRLLNFIPNIWPSFYERYLAYIMPSNFIIWKFKK